MKKRTILIIIISTALYSQDCLADDLLSRCAVDISNCNHTRIQNNKNKLPPITIHSDIAKSTLQNDIVFTGKVDIQQGIRHLLADKVQLHQYKKSDQSSTVYTVDALGNVYYNDNQIVLKGSKAWLNLNTKDANIWDGNYQMLGEKGRGVADKMQLRNNSRYVILKNGTFTSCLPNKNSWSIMGSEIIHDQEKQVAEIQRAKFKIGHIPIFYSPYLQFPIGNRRRTGFLIPNIAHSNSNGFQFAFPWYVNIAPQIDATITPNYLSKHGLQWQSEVRYLNQIGTGLVELNYLLKDRKKKKDEIILDSKEIDSHRWLFFWQHSDVHKKKWRFNSDFLKISDPYYFRDFGSKYFLTTSGYISQKSNISYFNKDLNVILSSKNFQIFGTQLPKKTYQARPQFDFNYYKNSIGIFDVHLYAQAVQFFKENKNLPDAVRLHLESTINLPITNNFCTLNAEAKFLATRYHQKNIHFNYHDLIDKNERNLIKKNTNRIIPQFKINGHIFLDRNISLIKGYIQTLEPIVQYLYIPYRNQNHIRTYDTTLLKVDYIGLFRDRVYSGLDRISSANHLSSGLTTRIYDVDLVEYFNFSVGQIYSFTSTRTEQDLIKNTDNAGILIWAGNTYFRINDHLDIHGDLQCKRHLNNIEHGSAEIEYHRDIKHIVQLNYNYSASKYMDDYLNNSFFNKKIYKNSISKIGMIASWPISDSWEIVGAYYHNTNRKESTNQILRLQRSSCCYTMQLGYERKINDLEKNSNKRDNQISFNIELRGLNQKQNKN